MNRDFRRPSRTTGRRRARSGFTEAGARATTIRGSDAPALGATSAIDRVSSLSNELVNRSTPVLFGSGVDAPSLASS
jgi:hypothetical protein